VNEGYVKLYRCILDNPFFSDSKIIHLWITLLVKASHKDRKIMFNKQLINLKAGQFVTGRKALSKITGLSESFIYRTLKVLESEQQIEQQKNNKYTVISILNWEKYQGNGTLSEQQNEQQVNSRRTASEQQVNTNKNDKNDKNDKNYTTPNETSPSEETKKVAKKKPAIKYDISFDFENEKWIGLNKKHFEDWLKAYPLVNFETELTKAKEWCMSNLTKATKKKRWRAYLNNWFDTAQQREERKAIYGKK